MARIHVLPTHLVNKIAAGEVIERPASVVKELVENAIDAGATRIDVTIEEGGAKRIAISDNGGGMDADDFANAFTPHATSKLTCDEDLFNINTMGFRGEALASIASISRAHIVTRRPADAAGWELDASGDTVGEMRPAATSPGTTVTIEDLFFNTPARRKFMRKASTEFGHISDQLTRLALPHPQIAFTLSHNSRTSVNLPATNTTAQRVADLFGVDVATDLIDVYGEQEAVSISGFISQPGAARSSTKWQYIFLNGRFIRDRLLTHALREAYRGLVDPSRFPMVVIFLQVPPDQVDVNVHPTKIEVRFQNSQAVHASLLASMREALNAANLARSVRLPDRPESEPGAETVSLVEAQRQQSLRSALTDFFKSAPRAQPTLGLDAPVTNQTDAPTPAHQPPMPTPRPDTPPTVPDRPMPAPHATPPIFQLDNTYIVANAGDRLLIVDQHALHERILYNEFHKRLADRPLESQRLLIPPTLGVTEAEADLLSQSTELLGRLGVSVETFGPNSVAIQQFPSLLIHRKVAPPEFLRGLLDALTDNDTHTPEALLESILEMMACKAAVKAGQALSTEEMHSLLAQRETATRGSACPHGRPTTIELPLAKLAKQFGRP